MLAVFLLLPMGLLSATDLTAADDYYVEVLSIVRAQVHLHQKAGSFGGRGVGERPTAHLKIEKAISTQSFPRFHRRGITQQ